MVQFEASCGGPTHCINVLLHDSCRETKASVYALVRSLLELRCLTIEPQPLVLYISE